MSDRSAKLLLEVARTIVQDSERNPSRKMMAMHDLHISASLLNEIRTWAEGYQIHIDRKCREKLKRPGVQQLMEDNEILQRALNVVTAQRDKLLQEEERP